MLQKTEFIWFDGKLVPWDQAQVHVLAHGLHYGTGVFEGIRAYACPDGSSAVFRLPEHSKRLVNSADEISKAIVETVVANKLSEGYIRPLAFAGEGDMGVFPGNNPTHVIIAVWPWGAYLGAEALEKGIRIKTSSFARMHVNTLMSKAKAAGNYVNSVLAKMEVKQDGYDEALMLDTNGYVCEATGENFFIVRNGVIKTPPLTAILGYTVEEQLFTRDEVYYADEAFFSGTAAELTPIRELDNRTIGEGHAGPVTKALQAAYFKAIKGQDPRYGHWLTNYKF